MVLHLQIRAPKPLEELLYSLGHSDVNPTGFPSDFYLRERGKVWLCRLRCGAAYVRWLGEFARAFTYGAPIVISRKLRVD